MNTSSFKEIKFHIEKNIGYLQLYRPQANNTINELLVAECQQVMMQCAEHCVVVVLQGLPEVFCFGADFQGIQQQVANGGDASIKPQSMYDLWLKIATGPYISIAQVRGKVNAGGVGFVAACDVVLADETAVFSLSELLFGLFPACVLPFLIQRIGVARAHYMTLTTQPITVRQALEWGLVDACEENIDLLLRKYFSRLCRLSKPAIIRYKAYMSELSSFLMQSKAPAIEANHAVFSDPVNLKQIARYVETGKFPWEG